MKADLPMIAHHQTATARPLSPVAAECLQVGVEAERIRRLSAVADYCGFQEGYADVPGFHSWTLRSPLGVHPARSTVSQATLERLLFGAGVEVGP